MAKYILDLYILKTYYLKPLAVHYNLDLGNLKADLNNLPTTIKKYHIHYNVKVNILMN